MRHNSSKIRVLFLARPISNRNSMFTPKKREEIMKMRDTRLMEMKVINIRCMNPRNTMEIMKAMVMMVSHSYMTLTDLVSKRLNL
jgi:hypothetical protein